MLLRALNVFAITALLAIPNTASAQSDREAALLAGISSVLHRDSAMCAARGCEKVGVLLSREDSASMPRVEMLHLLPVATVDSGVPEHVHRVLSVQLLHVAADSAIIRIYDLSDNSGPPSFTPYSSGVRRFHVDAGHRWEIRCEKKAGVWRVVRVEEAIS